MDKTWLIRLSALLPLILPIHTQAATEWGYQGEHGPDSWGKTFQTCGEGKNQSPIDIKQTIDAQLTPLHINYQGSITELVNNGHTIQANVSGNNTLTLAGKAYQLKQFHFHTPSENYLQGKQFPLEAHFVHASSQGELAVIGVMFATGERESDNIKTLLSVLPPPNTKQAINTAINPAQLLPRSREYYRFNGSLTTPPCSEGVRWFVLKEHLTSTRDEVEALQQAMGNNARPLQPLNARTILSSP
ncbi:carbonic anhydrase [Photobacterium swingsii]|uniref:Carbonic anhydrase n=1 Tax=Photobacterium swingsii TaxID=680026 RepID=A0A0J8V860_9GAMM|nr:carbonic anhydrase family protein [Photobacterium swingsii]KMV29618.1 carbonic anhydrase [Photobacterium swingsii]PSW22339.1 carbonic anhydrase [Photobacterium swingsii]